MARNRTLMTVVVGLSLTVAPPMLRARLAALVAAPSDPTGGPADPSARGSYPIHSVTLTTDTGGETSTLEVWLPRVSGPRPTVVITGGWGMSASSYTAIAQHLASRGFAAALFQEPSRWSTSTSSWATQLRGAIDRLESASTGSLAGVLDMEHLGLVGHSYGGAAVVWAAGEDARVKAVVALAPVNQWSWSGVTTEAGRLDAPILVVAGSWDPISVPGFYTRPLYDACTSVFARQFVEVSGAHMAPADWSQGTAAGAYATAWLERWLGQAGDPGGWTDGTRAARDVQAGNLVDSASSGHTAPASGSSATPASPSAPSPSVPAANGVLEQGSKGADVVALQDALAAAGHPAGASDGDFGPKTKAAVEAFQTANGLAADGVVGPATRAALGL